MSTQADLFAAAAQLAAPATAMGPASPPTAWGSASGSSQHNPLCADEAFCTRCRSTLHVDVPIHGGRSTRRDCAQCGRMLSFPKWGPQ